MSDNAEELKSGILEAIASKTMPEKVHFIFQDNEADIIHEESAIFFSGVINSPFIWIQQRIGSIDEKKANIVVDTDKLEIKLVTEERDFFKNTITGKLEEDEIFKQFAINTGTFRAASDWAALFKKHKYAFPSLADANSIILNMLNFKAKVSEEREKGKDGAGNVKDNFERKVLENNLPKAFQLSLPIFKGMKPADMDVEFEVNDRDLSLALYSDYAMIEAKKVRDEAIGEVIKNIAEIAPGIVVLYKS